MTEIDGYQTLVALEPEFQLPEGLQVIPELDDLSFALASALSSPFNDLDLYIPSTLISYTRFFWNVRSITVAEGNPIYMDDNASCLIEKDTGKLLLGSQTMKFTNALKEISMSSLSFLEFDKVVVPETVEKFTVMNNVGYIFISRLVVNSNFTVEMLSSEAGAIVINTLEFGDGFTLTNIDAYAKLFPTSVINVYGSPIVILPKTLQSIDTSLFTNVTFWAPNNEVGGLVNATIMQISGDVEGDMKFAYDALIAKLTYADWMYGKINTLVRIKFMPITADMNGEQINFVVIEDVNYKDEKVYYAMV